MVSSSEFIVLLEPQEASVAESHIHVIVSLVAALHVCCPHGGIVVVMVLLCISNSRYAPVAKDMAVNSQNVDINIRNANC